MGPEKQTISTIQRDKKAIKRAVYYLRNARMQGFHEIRIRCVTTTSKEVARRYANSLSPDQTVDRSIVFHQWGDPVWSFSGDTAHVAICSGFGEQKVLEELFSRLRNHDPRVGSWGNSLEIVA